MGLLDGKVILVTGAGAGIGRCHALACAEAGARVVVNDTGGGRDGSSSDPAAAAEVVAEIEAAGGQAVANSDSVTDPAGCARMVAAAVEHWGGLDGVVNNAGILRDRTFAKLSDSDWRSVLDVHLEGTRQVCAASLTTLAASGSGAIVNTTSYSGLIGNFGQANYAAAKAGIYGLTRVLALELRKQGITANCVAPVAKTRMTAELDMVDASWRPEQISPLVVFLLSDRARDVTGTVFGVQGQRIHLYEVRTNAGVAKPGADLWTPEEIAKQLPAICRWDGQEAPLLEESSNRWPLGKRYEGGTHLVEQDDWLVYAAATDDGNPRYAGPDGVAPPMFHVRPLIGLLLALARDPELGIDMLRLVHGSHGMAFHQPLRHGDALVLSAELASVDEKSSGTIYGFRLFGHVAEQLALEGETAFFVRAKPDPAAPKKKREPRPAPELPEPSWTRSQPVAEDQALRYADASNDRNPIHVDPEVARSAGLSGCILHGLCTMAFAQRDLIEGACGGDPSRLASISVRFAGMVVPGETLSMSVWEQDDGSLAFATAGPSGKPVITHGRATVHPE